MKKLLKNQHYLKWRNYLLDAPIMLNDKWNTKLASPKSNTPNKKDMSGNMDLSEEMILSTIATSGYYCERIREIMPHLPAISDKQLNLLSGNSSRLDLLKAGFQAIHKAIDLPLLSNKVKLVFGDSSADCKARTAVLIAMFIDLIKKLPNKPEVISISYQVGIVFHQKHASNGIGHAWVKIGDNIADPSIVTNGILNVIPSPYEGYIPIGMYQLVVNSSSMRIQATPLICCRSESQV